MGMYIQDGLSPSPVITMKIQPQLKQRTHDNDFIAQCIGLGYQQKHHSFRQFFAYQDPLMIPPPKEKCLNFKVDEFFQWMRFIMKKAWGLSKDFALGGKAPSQT